MEDASEITSIASQAYETANKAYLMSREALDKQTLTQNQMTVLEVNVHEMREKLQTVLSLAAHTLRDSTDAYNQAINVFQQADTLEVPEADHERLEDQAEKIAREAARIEEESRRLIEDNAELLRNAQDRRASLEDLLARAEAQQQQVEAQKAEAETYRERAGGAVELGNTVLNDARNTLSTLQG